MTREDFAEKIKEVCGVETTAHPQTWTPDNPFLGHCTVVSLLAQDFFGGEIMRTDLHAVPGFEEFRRHSWNRLPSGQEIDFTVAQFPRPLPDNLVVRVASREELFSYPGIQKRYELLKEKFHKHFSL
jgi:hypothetical protein